MKYSVCIIVNRYNFTVKSEGNLKIKALKVSVVLLARINKNKEKQKNVKYF